MRIRDEQGQALVETAVSMGLFIVLMLGAVEVGSLAYTAMAVNSAAKAAANKTLSRLLLPLPRNRFRSL